MKRVILLSFLFVGITVLPAFAAIPSISYLQQHVAEQIASAVANKADKISVDSLSETIGNFPNYSVLGSGWNIVYSTLKEPGWPHDFLGNTTWNIPTNIGEFIEMLFGKTTVYDGLLYTVFYAIYTEISSLTTKITTAQTTAETAKSQANANAVSISTRVDTSATANQTMAGSYTVSGTFNVPTPTLPTAE